MNYNIIATGSHGNSVVINKHILIDCGVAYKHVLEHVNDLSLVLLTHIHSDHFKNSTIRKLAFERPSLRFGCCLWLYDDLIKCGVSKGNIDVYNFDSLFDYNFFKLETFYLKHDVMNCGYKIYFENKKIFYATDTNSLSGIFAKDFDLYLIEANHTEEDIDQRISDKKEAGEFAYEIKAKHNHLSKEKTDIWLANNAGNDSKFIYMHEHRED